jgi:hypothetical protein
MNTGFQRASEHMIYRTALESKGKRCGTDGGGEWLGWSIICGRFYHRNHNRTLGFRNGRQRGNLDDRLMHVGHAKPC